ncbi:MAG: hypothetical protein LWX02_13440, partial [Deltaproteobacteria bacterium]|nr:hypothetical protein [Deltaproteobacteria bacterium]MDL1989109.1 hypothetical protein [Deltaproteobacteria bacterium]
FSCCQIILKCYSNFLFHHGLFLFGFLFPNITLEKDRDLINFKYTTTFEHYQKYILSKRIETIVIWK